MESDIIGGVGKDEFDYFHELVSHTERARLFTPGFEDSIEAGLNIATPCLIKYGTNEKHKEVTRQVINGDTVICLAITEPFTGSDVASIQTTAVKSPDGTHYIVNGANKWITNGTFAKWFVTAVKTGSGRGGISLLLIERTEGVETEVIKTSYSSAAGTAYITFDNVKVPAENLIGQENKGFLYILNNFNHERATIAMYTVARARVVIEESIKWAYQRKVFGKRLITVEAIQQKLAEMISVFEASFQMLLDVLYQMQHLPEAEQG